MELPICLNLPKDVPSFVSHIKKHYKNASCSFFDTYEMMLYHQQIEKSIKIPLGHANLIIIEGIEINSALRTLQDQFFETILTTLDKLPLPGDVISLIKTYVGKKQPHIIFLQYSIDWKIRFYNEVII